MHRRGLIRGLLTAITGGLAAGGSTARAETAPSGTAKVAYHLCDLDKVNMALGNIRNHFRGAGPEGVTIELVVLGPALKTFHANSARPDVKEQITELRKSGLVLSACANTMHSSNITVKDLLPGFTSAERGGVVQLAELQRQGYAYIRP
jgi:intracellular sulfur oxidation DsrE/DsrF family protein